MRELATKLTEQSTDVESWIICKEDDDSDTLWAFEFCKDDETLALHESNQDVEKSHEAIIELLAEPPVRIVVRPTAASMQLLRP